MSFDPKKPAFTPIGSQPTLYTIIKENPGTVTGVPADSGIFHTLVPNKPLQFKLAAGESMIQHGGASIVLGTDRPSTIFSGFGARGYQNSATIDMVVGRGASAKGGDGPKEGSVVSNMFSSDAARIYISQLTKIDENFGIASGVPGRTRPGAGIGIKADDVRIIARNSFKLCTGRGSGFEGHGSRGETNAFGGKSTIAPTIELIAGNYSEEKWVYGGLKNPIETVPYLQAAVKGENLTKALTELNEIVGNVWSAVYNLCLIQTGYNVTNSIDPWRPWNAAQGPPAAGGMLSFALTNLWATRVKATMWEQYYLVPSGYRYINSPNVFLT
tara:strand:- start:633 stop:1616 length:984 start_codon:yes stop_codon:yes gene_type:complete